jgi:hypothetical protein
MKNKKNEESVEGLMSKITDLWKDEILGCINKKYLWRQKHSILHAVHNGIFY